MLAPAYIMLREASEDTILQIAKPQGEEGTISLPIAKGTQVITSGFAHCTHFYA